MNWTALRGEVQEAYWSGLIDAWYPACLDENNGGFCENLSREFWPGAYPSQFVVYQSRLTWSAARAVLAGSRKLAPIVQSGSDNLWNRFWDEARGGFYWQVDFDGQPVGRSVCQRHTYGLAFAIYALAAASRALKTSQAEERLSKALGWFAAVMHDGECGGWFEACSLEGAILLESPDGYPKDLLSVAYGDKAQNSQLHVLEALTECHRARGDADTATLLGEMVEVVAKRLRNPMGHLNLYVSRDWSPTSQEPSYGHDIEAAFLLRDALDALGESDPEVEQITRELALNALEHAWDKDHGGLLDQVSWHGHNKVWWVQAESLGALVYLASEDHPEAARFAPYAFAQWQFIRTNMLDPEFGGLYPYVSADGSEPLRTAKGDPWTGLYHEARAFLTVLDRIPDPCAKV